MGAHSAGRTGGRQREDEVVEEQRQAEPEVSWQPSIRDSVTMVTPSQPRRAGATKTYVFNVDRYLVRPSRTLEGTQEAGGGGGRDGASRARIRGRRRVEGTKNGLPTVSRSSKVGYLPDGPEQTSGRRTSECWRGFGRGAGLLTCFTGFVVDSGGGGAFEGE